MQNRLSVVLSVYDAETFIEETIRCVLAQTLSDFQFVVVDDGSRDNTVHLIRQIDDPRLELIELPENVGIPAARNVGLRAASGEFVAVVDADDPPFCDRFEKQIAFLEQHPQVAVVGCQFRVMNEAGLQVSDSKAHNDSPVGRVANLTNILRGSISTMHPCAMYRGDVLRKFRYDERFAVGHDYDLGLRLYEGGWVSDNLDEYLNLHCDHPRSVTDRFQSVDFQDHHLAFVEFVERLTGMSLDDDELKAYAWSYHFRFLPPGVQPIDSVRSLDILRILLDAYVAKHPDLVTQETYNAVLAGAAPREAVILRAYWKELLTSRAAQGALHLYGAGRHSVWVVQLCRELDIDIETIFDDVPKQDELSGIPVRETGQLDQLTAGTVILSSDVHHRTMSDALASRFAERAFTICNPYEDFPLGPFEKY